MKEVICNYKNEVYSAREDGSVMRHSVPGRKVRPSDNVWTFGKINLRTGYPEIVTVPVHRIVCTAFNGPALSAGHVVDHKDTNKQNNRPENLRWVTRLENILLNPVTVKRIEYACGCSIEEWLVDAAKFRDKFQQQGFSWMRSVSAEEGKLTLERLQNWAASDKQPSGGTLGEWIYNRGSWYNDASQIMPSKTSNASQRNWKTICDFPFCPPSVDGDPIAAYARRLGPGNAFSTSQGKISVAYRKKISEDGSILYVIAEWQYGKGWVLAKITYSNVQFIHEILGTFPELEGAERKLAEAQGKEWTPASHVDGGLNEVPRSDQPVEKLSNTIASKTPGAVQRNWKVVSEFPGVPQGSFEEPLLTYLPHLTTGTVFCTNDKYTSLVFKPELSPDGQSLFVITHCPGGVKEWALAKVNFENGVFVHESIGSFFEQRGAERMLCESLGNEWTGEEGIDDYC